jgi:hypothetical protein
MLGIFLLFFSFLVDFLAATCLSSFEFAPLGGMLR